MSFSQRVFLCLFCLAATACHDAAADLRLQLDIASAELQFDVLRDTHALANNPLLRADTLPAFSFTYVRSGARLLPVETGPVPGPHPLWEYLLGVGRVVAATPGAAETWELPVSLQERNANCIHNGWLRVTFAADSPWEDRSGVDGSGPDGFRADGFGRGEYVVDGETCQYFQWNLKAEFTARASATEVDERDQIIGRHAAWESSRLPVRPMGDLSAVFPGISPQAFANATRISPADMTVYGLVVGGVHYRGGCSLRGGRYPDCEQLFIPSYSTAKSLFAALALLRLEALYPGSSELSVAACVPQCSGDRWGDVRLVDALDMATGRYDSPVPMADEDNPEFSRRFFLPERHPEKIAFACTTFPRREAAGRRWVYHTSDTYLLSTAMSEFLRRQRGESADLFDDLLQPVLASLELSPATRRTRRSYDAVAQPFAGYGLTFLPDDLARLATALGSGRLQEHFDPTMLDAALQRPGIGQPLPRGLPAMHGLYYSHGFFAQDLQTLLGCAAPAWMPFMSGYGGIRVALLPGGNLYYYVSDSGNFDWAEPLRELHRFSPLC